MNECLYRFLFPQDSSLSNRALRLRTMAVSPASTQTQEEEEGSNISSSTLQPKSVDEQRRTARALTEYFQEQELVEKFGDGQVFGWIQKNEINNGRWAMFGLAVGLLTEYSTGVNFVDQILIVFSNLGIADVY